MKTSLEIAGEILYKDGEAIEVSLEYVASMIRQAREEMRQECARIALNEPRVLEHDAPDPQHRIEAKIRAIENE